MHVCASMWTQMFWGSEEDIQSPGAGFTGHLTWRIIWNGFWEPLVSWFCCSWWRGSTYLPEFVVGFSIHLRRKLGSAARPSWIVLGVSRDAGSIWKSQEAGLESAESGLTGQGRTRFPWAALRTWGKWDEKKEYASLGFRVIFTFMGTQHSLLTPQKDFL